METHSSSRGLRPAAELADELRRCNAAFTSLKEGLQKEKEKRQECDKAFENYKTIVAGLRQEVAKEKEKRKRCDEGFRVQETALEEFKKLVENVREENRKLRNDITKMRIGRGQVSALAREVAVLKAQNISLDKKMSRLTLE